MTLLDLCQQMPHIQVDMPHAVPADFRRILFYNTWPVRSVHETGFTQSLIHLILLTAPAYFRQSAPIGTYSLCRKTAQADAQVCCIDVASPLKRRSLCRTTWQSSEGLHSEFLPGNLSC